MRVGTWSRSSLAVSRCLGQDVIPWRVLQTSMGDSAKETVIILNVPTALLLWKGYRSKRRVA